MLQTRATIEGAGESTRPLAVSDLGLIGYEECWRLQEQYVTERAQGHIPDMLLLLEHPHTFTCGRAGGRDNILATEEELRKRGVAVLDVDRGGDVTYHGPGQLVAYPIINLAEHALRRDLHGYIRTLERSIISTLANFLISAYPLRGLSGVWVTHNGVQEKIAALGVKVNGRAITSHGIALNVNTDFSFFDMIVPCGISDKGVTSMAQLLPSAPSMGEVKRVFASEFARVFGFHY